VPDKCEIILKPVDIELDSKLEYGESQYLDFVIMMTKLDNPYVLNLLIYIKTQGVY
jgi:hypothetical protein